MKTIHTNVYTFDELKTDKAKDRARDWFREFALDYEWWCYTFEDAARIGLKITEFGLDRGAYANGTFTKPGCEVARLVKENHGKDCETYKTAKNFLREWDELVSKHSDGIDTETVSDDKENEFDQEADALEAEFLRSLLEDYRIILQHECEYLMSDESVDESIRANEYTFTESGKRFG